MAEGEVVSGADTGSATPPPSAPTFSAEDLSVDLSFFGAGDEAGGDAPEASADSEGTDQGQISEGSDDGQISDSSSDGEMDSSGEVEGDTILSAHDEEGEPDAQPAAKGNDWTSLRQSAIAKALKGLEPTLARRVTAAELPKELEKRRSSMERQLGRYATLEDALLAGLSAQDKIRSGQHKSLPENPSEAELAQWREDVGIPKDAKDYDARIPDHQWTENDQPILESFKEAAHAANFTQGQLSAATQWFKNYQDFAKQTMLEQQTQIDRADTKAARDLLRDQLEGDFGPSLTLMDRYLKDSDVFPDGLGEAIVGARLPDGRRMINNPNVAKWLIENARSHYGEGAMITGESAVAQASEESELDALLNSNVDEYRYGKWKNTGISASERALQIARQKESRGRRVA